MTLKQRGELVVARFFEAITTLEETYATEVIIYTCGIDKRNFYRKRKGVGGNTKIPASWLSAICTEYKVSAKWLLLGRGKMFE